MAELTLKQVSEKLGCSMSTIYKLKSHPEFPTPSRYISQKMCWWSDTEIDKFSINQAKKKFRN